MGVFLPELIVQDVLDSGLSVFVDGLLMGGLWAWASLVDAVRVVRVQDGVADAGRGGGGEVGDLVDAGLEDDALEIAG